MRRNIPCLIAGGATGSHGLRTSAITQTVRLRILTQDRAPGRNILSVERVKGKLENPVDEMPSSSPLGQNKELALILQEVEQISKALTSESADIQTLRNTLDRLISCAANQSLLDRELWSLALTDDLTGLYNRRAFLALAEQQLRVTHRKAQGLLLFFADVDNLKEINNTFGHRAGDLALVRAADALEHTFRDSDVVARLGGDEFAVLALEASCENREVILHRLEKFLNGSKDESLYDLSLTVGMARFDPKHPISLEKLIAMADEAMYEGKKNRRKLSAAS